MKKLRIFALILAVIIVCEMYMFSLVNKMGGVKAPAPSPQEYKILDPEEKKKYLQSLFIKDIADYIQSSDSAKKKLMTALIYNGNIKSITKNNQDKITLSIQDEDGKVLQTYLNWKAEKFVVYKKKGIDLFKTDIEHLKKGDIVSVREIEEIRRDSMSLKEMSNIVSYIEITQL